MRRRRPSTNPAKVAFEGLKKSIQRSNQGLGESKAPGFAASPQKEIKIGAKPKRRHQKSALSGPSTSASLTPAHVPSIPPPKGKFPMRPKPVSLVTGQAKSQNLGVGSTSSSVAHVDAVQQSTTQNVMPKVVISIES